MKLKNHFNLIFLVFEIFSFEFWSSTYVWSVIITDSLSTNILKLCLKIMHLKTLIVYRNLFTLFWKQKYQKYQRYQKYQSY